MKKKKTDILSALSHQRMTALIVDFNAMLDTNKYNCSFNRLYNNFASRALFCPSFIHISSIVFQKSLNTKARQGFVLGPCCTATLLPLCRTHGLNTNIMSTTQSCIFHFYQLETELARICLCNVRKCMFSYFR